MNTSEITHCLLCTKKKADKLNSHILPKFMTERILRSGRRNVGTYSSTPGDERVVEHYEQGTAKENNILCSSCEQYFCQLENEFSRSIHTKLRDPRHKDDFAIARSTVNALYTLCTRSNKNICILFLYSVIFRFHISIHSAFKNFKLKDDEIDLLRSELAKYNAMYKRELIGKLEREPMLDFLKFYLSTPENLLKETTDLIMHDHNLNNEYYYTVLGEYILKFKFNKMNISKKMDDQKHFTITMIKDYKWKEVHQTNMNSIFEIIKNNKQGTISNHSSHL